MKKFAQAVKEMGDDWKHASVISTKESMAHTKSSMNSDDHDAAIMRLCGDEKTGYIFKRGD